MAERSMPPRRRTSPALPRGILSAILLLVSAFVPLAFSQEGQADIETLKKTAPKVFIDCSSCDLEYIKTEITFVNYVRDRKEALVHVLITRLTTGSGGLEYTLSFIGQGPYEGLNDEVKFFSSSTDTEDEIRKGQVKALKLGLAVYAARTPIASRMEIQYSEPTKPQAGPDKWKGWVFSLSGEGWFNGESSVQDHNWGLNVSANRTTPASKIRLGLSASFSKDRFTFEEETVESVRESYSASGLYVFGLSNHWSWGIYLNAGSSTYENRRFSLSPQPAVEYNVFPYSQATRRQLRLMYRIGPESVRYRELTIYDKIQETLFRQSLSATLDVKEKWGSVSLSLSGAHYFHDPTKYNLNLWGSLQLNLFKGLNATVAGGGSRIHDQLSLIKGSATLEEVLLRRRQLETGYQYFVMFGLSYSFGSIYTNVVNPRFGSMSGGGISVEID
jgi:hypothetical protein